MTAPLNRPVRITRTVTGADGHARFEDRDVPLHTDRSPIAQSAVLPATAISFRWTPGDYDSDFHPAPRRRLIIIVDGLLEVRTRADERRFFAPGDVLEVADTTGHGHISRSADGRAFRTVIINLDDTLVHDRLRPVENPVPADVPFLRTIDGPDGRSITQAGRMPYVRGALSGMVTEELPLSGYQLVRAPADLAYDWHPAPRRQVVVPLTGGMRIENGAGAHHVVRPGEIYFGEDVAGQGHITRALDGQERLCIFAHLR